MIGKRRFLFGVVLLMPLALSAGGCWDHVAMGERTIVVGVGIDLTSGSEPILLTLQVANLSAGNSAGSGIATGEGGAGGKGSRAKNAVVVETSKGRSLYDAIHNFFRYSSRQLIFSHNKIVILGNELAKSGVASVFDDMVRDYQFRATNWILVAEDTAKEILQSQTDLGTIPAVEINRMMTNLEKNGSMYPVDRNDFVLRLKGEGNTSLAPLIQIESRETNPFPRIRIGKMAVFKEDRLIDVLDTNESRALSWFIGRSKGRSVVFPDKLGKAQTGISVEIIKGPVRIRPRKTKDGIIMEITGTGDGILRETENIANNSGTIAQLERAVERILKEQVERTIRHAQQTGADFLGYARIIHGDYPDVWHRISGNWEQEFPRIRSRVHFDIDIVRFGLFRDSLLDAGGRK